MPSVLRTIHPIPESAVVKSRLMILREYMDRNRKRMLMPLNGTRWHEPVTERPELDSVEIWSFANATADIHPSISAWFAFRSSTAKASTPMNTCSPGTQLQRRAHATPHPPTKVGKTQSRLIPKL